MDLYLRLFGVMIILVMFTVDVTLNVYVKKSEKTTVQVYHRRGVGYYMSMIEYWANYSDQ